MRWMLVIVLGYSANFSVFAGPDIYDPQFTDMKIDKSDPVAVGMAAVSSK